MQAHARTQKCVYNACSYTSSPPIRLHGLMLSLSTGTN